VAHKLFCGQTSKFEVCTSVRGFSIHEQRYTASHLW